MAGFWIFVIIALICGSLLFGAYMSYCAELKVKMFKDNSTYEKRLKYLEEQMKKLTEDTK